MGKLSDYSTVSGADQSPTTWKNGQDMGGEKSPGIFKGYKNYADVFDNSDDEGSHNVDS